jgi:hypothetical protein
VHVVESSKQAVNITGAAVLMRVDFSSCPAAVYVYINGMCFSLTV